MIKLRDWNHKQLIAKEMSETEKILLDERVVRDLPRKLTPNDRLMGAFSLCIKQGVIPRNISIGINAAMHFKDSTTSEMMFEIEEYGLKESIIIIRSYICWH